MTHPRTYPLRQSPLYRLSSKKRLALLLGIGVPELKLLCDLQDSNFRRWELGRRERDKLIDAAGKPKKRKIQQPKSVLQSVHKRIALLLGRIEKPDFVYSATKRRSYLDNAIRHQTDQACVKVDVKDFYSSVKFRRVRRFFLEQLECAEDVANLLARLCCVDGALPTGSAVSPVLSYFACAPMFAEIESLARRRGLIFTLYVDDMVFSGECANKCFAQTVCLLLQERGFVGHKVTHYRAGTVKVVTGVAVRAGFLDLPFARKRRIRRTEEAFLVRANRKTEEAGSERTNREELRILGRTLIGQYREAERISPGIKVKAAPIEAELTRRGLGAGHGGHGVSRKRSVRSKPSAKVFDELRAQRAKARAKRVGSLAAKAALPLDSLSCSA